MDVNNLYKEKLCSPAEAVKGVKSGDVVDYGYILLKPVECDKALAARAEELENVCIYVALTVPPIPEVAKHPKSFIYNDWHFSKITRMMKKQGLQVFHNPLIFRRGSEYYEIVDKIPGARSYYFDDPEKAKDVKKFGIFTAAPMDENGNFNMGILNAATYSMAKEADVVIVEVNQNIPIALGGSEESIHVSDVDHIVEAPPEQQIVQIPTRKPSAVQRKIAAQVIEHIKDGDCIQLGIGGVPNSVGKLIAQSDLKDLGCHTEMLVDAYIDMIESGVMTGAKKNIDKNKVIYTFAIGTTTMHDFINNNDKLESHPVSYTNDSKIIQKIDNFVSVCNAVQVDLFGQVNAESRVVDGIPEQVSGTGGILDWVQGSQMSKNGRSFICLPSTYKPKGGKKQSRIVPTFEPGTIVSIPRGVVDYIVTENGAVKLVGSPVWSRAKKLISIAHPDFQEELTEAAKKMGILR